MDTQTQMTARLRTEYTRASTSGGHVHGLRCVEVVADSYRGFAARMAQHTPAGDRKLAADLDGIDAAERTVVAEATARHAEMVVA